MAQRRCQGRPRPARRPARGGRPRPGRPADPRRRRPVAAHRVRRLPALRELTAARWAAHGELAFLLEGDLKEAAGGLRDVGVLRAIAAPGVTDALRPAVRAAHRRLLDTRDALHLAVGRRVDRLVAQERDGVAALLGCDSPWPPCPTPSGRTARAVPATPSPPGTRCCAGWPGRPHGPPRPRRRLAGRRPGAAPAGTAPARRPAVRRPVARDVVEQDGELVLARTAIGAATRPEPVAAGGRRGGHHPAADRAGDLRMAGRVLPAAARALAAGRPGRADHPARRRSRPGAGLGDLRPVRADRRLAARVDPAAQPAPAQPGAPVHPGPAPGADRVRGQPARPGRWTGRTCCCSARSCTTSARACPGDHSDRRRRRWPRRSPAGSGCRRPRWR